MTIIDIDRLDNVDIHELLAGRRQVAVVWSTEDVQSVRPDLNDDQVWDVLQQCRKVHDCEIGFTWLLIETVADDLFPVRIMTDADNILDDLFHGSALAAFVAEAVDRRQWPDPEATRRRAFALYERALATRNR